MHKTSIVNRPLLGGLLLASIALTACNRQEPPKTAGQTLDAGIAKAKDATADAKESVGVAARATGAAISDTAITAEVKGKLATDSDLKTLDISVDTKAGQIVLEGTAPNSASRDRATKLAAAVGGVTNVDNRLTVKQ
jgi:hyperosmotically inducible protein